MFAGLGLLTVKQEASVATKRAVKSSVDLRDWSKPTAVDNITLAFPADVRDLMPAYADIPAEFKSDSNKWVKFQQTWFFRGLGGAESDMAEGVDGPTAWRHLKAIQGSFQPKHEHKEAAVAYLASLWFTDVRYSPALRKTEARTDGKKA